MIPVFETMLSVISVLMGMGQNYGGNLTYSKLSKFHFA